MPDVNVPSVASFRPVATDIKPPPQTAGFGSMSIGDIVNMAATMQSFEKAKATMPYEIEQKEAESRIRQLEAQKAGVDLNMHNANISRGVFGGFLSDPDFINGNSDAMIKKLTQGKRFLQSIGVTPPDNGEMFNTLIEEAKTNPGAAYQTIKNGVQQAGGAASQYQTQQQYQAPQVYQMGGAQQPPGGQPTGVTPDQMSRPANQQQPQGMRLNFQPRQAGDVRPVAPGEAEEAAIGQKYLAGLNDFGVNAVSYKRNVDEVLAEAKKLEQSYGPTSGILGAARRKVATWAGDPTYTQLSKDLANVQIAALKAAGADLQTDAGKQLVRMANGDETFPPEVLINIANRTKADITNVELQRQAAARFNQRYPGYANFGAFKQAWADNADSKVFQAMNIYRDENLNGDEKKAMIDKLLGPNESDRKQFYQKYQNINKLVNTGSL